MRHCWIGILIISFFIAKICKAQVTAAKLSPTDFNNVDEKVITIHKSKNLTIRIVDGYIDTSRLTTGFIEVKRIHNESFSSTLGLPDTTKVVEIFNTENTPFEDYIYSHFENDFQFIKINGISFYSKRPLLLNGELLDVKKMKCLIFNGNSRSKIQKIEFISEQSLTTDIRKLAPFGVIKVTTDGL